MQPAHKAGHQVKRFPHKKPSEKSFAWLRRNPFVFFLGLVAA
jgi:hypothetical protein